MMLRRKTKANRAAYNKNKRKYQYWLSDNQQQKFSNTSERTLSIAFVIQQDIVTEACLKSRRKSEMEVFCKNN